MTLLLRRRTIERAVAGTLSGTEELRLRAHLASCERCRAFYDELSRAALALDPEGAADRERARLEALLDASPSPEAAPAPLRPRLPLRWAIPVAGLVAVAAGFLLLPRAPRVGGEGVLERGAADANEPVPAGHLLVWAKPKAGPGDLRLVAEFPGAGEGRVSRDEWVQLSCRHALPQAFVYVVGVDAQGALHRYWPREGVPEAPLASAEQAVALGPSFDLAARHPAGPLRLYTFFAERPADLAALEQALRRRASQPADGEAALARLPSHVVGVLLVEP